MITMARILAITAIMLLPVAALRAADAPAWSVIVDGTFADEEFRQRRLLEGEAGLELRNEGGRRFLRMRTLQSASDKHLHHSVLWYRERLEGDLRFEFRARAQKGNGTIFCFNARTTTGSRFKGIFDWHRPDSLEERYSGSPDFEAYTFGYLRSPALNLRHVGGVTASAWPAPWTKENSARYDRESIFLSCPSPFGEQCDTWRDFDISVIGDLISAKIDGRPAIDYRDTDASPEGTLAWKPFCSGGWTGFRIRRTESFPTQTMKNSLPLVIGLLLAPLTSLHAGDAPKPAGKLNIVLFLIDDLDWRDIGCQGSTYYHTPNIDRLAREGARFTDAYAACAVCSPTRAAVLTGKYKELRGELGAWRREVGAEMMRPNPDYDPTVQLPAKGKRKNTKGSKW